MKMEEDRKRGEVEDGTEEEVAEGPEFVANKFVKLWKRQNGAMGRIAKQRSRGKESGSSDEMEDCLPAQVNGMPATETEMEVRRGRSTACFLDLSDNSPLSPVTVNIDEHDGNVKDCRWRGCEGEQHYENLTSFHRFFPMIPPLLFTRGLSYAFPLCLIPLFLPVYPTT